MALWVLERVYFSNRTHDIGICMHLALVSLLAYAGLVHAPTYSETFHGLEDAGQV